MKDNIQYSCIIPTLPADYHDTSKHLYMLFDMLSISRLIFIGPDELRQPVLNDAKEHDICECVEFINENDIIPFGDVKQAYNTRLSEIESEFGKPEKVSRAGWYYQQFLKMEYHKLCEDEYYLCWDADTIPLRKIEMFHNSGTPYLDTKTEYMHSYFDTLYNLFRYEKVIDQSFISEHMLFSKTMMAEMINDIMATQLAGNSFYEKIFSAIQQPFQGFSEFETYGSWIAKKYPSAYRLRKWKSIRNTSFIINRSDLNNDDLKWLATGFDAASFERYQETEPELTELFRNQRYRNKMTVDVFYNELLEMGLFGEFKNGGLIKDDRIFPI